MSMKKRKSFTTPPWKRFGLSSQDRAIFAVMCQEARRAFLLLDNREFDKFIAEEFDPDDPRDQMLQLTRQMALINGGLITAFMERFLGVTPEELRRWNKATAEGRSPVGVEDHRAEGMSDLIDEFTSALGTEFDDTEH